MDIPKVNPKEERLARENYGLIVFMAKKFNPKNITELEEYISAGHIGLLKAIRHPNPKGWKLTTLVCNSVKWEILRYIKDSSKMLSHSDLWDTDIEIESNDELFESIPDTLTENESKMIRLRSEGYTFDTIGQLMGGYTKGWVSNHLKVAINKIKRSNSLDY